VYVPVEGELGEPESVGLTEEDAVAEADAAEGSTVTEITTTVTTEEGADAAEPTTVGLTEEQAAA
jgi:hypothetical protein